MNGKSKTLLGCCCSTASPPRGGLALMTDWIPKQASWVRETDFSSNYLPGLILMAGVGGGLPDCRQGETQLGLAPDQHRCQGRHGVLDHGRGGIDPWIPFPQVITLGTGALVVWCTSARDRSSEPSSEELAGAWSTLTVLAKRPVPANSRDPDSALRLTEHWTTPQPDRGARNPSSSD